MSDLIISLEEIETYYWIIFAIAVALFWAATLLMFSLMFDVLRWFQKRKRTKKRAIADEVINSQKQLNASEINKLIDELISLNNWFVGKTEDDRVRVSKLREIRDET